MEALESIGHKRLLLLTGEHPKYSFDHFLEAVSVVRVCVALCFEAERGEEGDMIEQNSLKIMKNEAFVSIQWVC